MSEDMKAVLNRAKCIYTKEQIELAIGKMAEAVSAKLKDSNPVVICVMKGGILVTSELILKLDFPLELEYVHASRYGDDSTGSDLKWRVKPRMSLTDRTVLLVDDILDGGITLARIKEQCEKLGAKEVYSAVLLDKVNKRVPNGLPNADFSALELEDCFVFGYGLDYQESLRNVQGIYEAATEDQF